VVENRRMNLVILFSTMEEDMTAKRFLGFILAIVIQVVSGLFAIPNLEPVLVFIAGNFTAIAMKMVLDVAYR
jgi:hypothetical protein